MPFIYDAFFLLVKDFLQTFYTLLCARLTHMECFILKIGYDYCTNLICEVI